MGRSKAVPCELSKGPTTAFCRSCKGSKMQLMAAAAHTADQVRDAGAAVKLVLLAAGSHNAASATCVFLLLSKLSACKLRQPVWPAALQQLN